MRKVRFGIVGVGNQGTHYANLLKDNKVINGELIALCDNDPEKLQIAKDKFGSNENVKFYDNYISMLDDNVCDALLVETPHYDHPEIVIECLKKNIMLVSRGTDYLSQRLQ